MNSIFTAKLLQNLRNKKADKGFTLIELLVVVIIIGVLAAVALPNLLGQVGKAREAEAKNAIGSINRGQQNYHFEARTFIPVTMDDASFSTIQNPLGISLVSDVYNYAVPTGTAALSGFATATPNAATSDGVRGFGGTTAFTAATGVYGMVVCQGNSVGSTPTGGTVNTATPSSNACANGVVLK